MSFRCGISLTTAIFIFNDYCFLWRAAKLQSTINEGKSMNIFSCFMLYTVAVVIQMEKQKLKSQLFSPYPMFDQQNLLEKLLVKKENKFCKVCIIFYYLATISAILISLLSMSFGNSIYEFSFHPPLLQHKLFNCFLSIKVMRNSKHCIKIESERESEKDEHFTSRSWSIIKFKIVISKASWKWHDK